MGPIADTQNQCLAGLLSTSCILMLLFLEAEAAFLLLTCQAKKDGFPM